MKTRTASQLMFDTGDVSADLAYPTGRRGRTLRSGTAGASPAHRGARIEYVALARRRSSPCPPGAGDARVDIKCQPELSLVDV